MPIGDPSPCWACGRYHCNGACGRMAAFSSAPAAPALRVNTYEVLRRAVEEGVAYGYRRAHKHDDAPSPAAVQQAVIDAVMNEVGEVFVFDDPHEGPGHG